MANHGLFIGIDYRGTANALRGCINDANDLHGGRGVHDAKAMAGTLGDVCATAELLLEEKATKAGIVAAIRAVLAKLAAGDTAIITYSGHGTQVPDRAGVEVDGYDEAMCPYDLRRNLLLDDELRSLLMLKPEGSRVFLMTDCCHSGTMTKDLAIDGYRSPRSLSWEQLTDGMSEAEIDSLLCRCRQTPRLSLARGESDLAGVVFLSGCKDDEVSYDATFGGRANGAMTYFALQAYKALPKGATFGEWYERIQQQLPSRKYPQSPCMSDEGREWFVPGYEPATTAVQPMPDGVPPKVSITVGTWRSKEIVWERIT